MGQFGEVAVRAVKRVASGNTKDPRVAWKGAAAEVIKTCSTRCKGCPRSVFLGLCEEGMVLGVPPGAYLKQREDQKKNKKRAIKAVEILQTKPSFSAEPKALWDTVIGVLREEPTTYEQQMDVVTALWENGLVVV